MRNNKTVLFFCILLILSLSMVFSFNSIANNEDCDDPAGESSPGDAKNCKIRPLSFDENIPDEITCGTPVTITIKDGSPDFVWQVSGHGYTLTEISERQYSLSCASGCTCGEGNDEAGAVATVTVSDSCNQPISISLRNFKENGARWSSVEHETHSYSVTEDAPNGCGITWTYTPFADQSYEEVIEGDRRWAIYLSYYNLGYNCESQLCTDWKWKSGSSANRPPAGGPYYSFYEYLNGDQGTCSSTIGPGRLYYHYYEWRCN